MSLKDLIKQRINRIDSIPDNLKTVIDDQNEVMFKSILSRLKQLDTEAGKIIASKKNLAVVQSIADDLKKLLFNGDYVDAIAEFASEIGKQADLNDKILESVVGTFTPDELYKSVVQSSQHNALQLLDQNAVSSNFIQSITDILNTAVVSGVSYADAVESLRNSMVGDNAVFSKYAGQIVHDAFAISDRQYVQLTARNHGIEFYRYDGGHIEGTRPFCDERYGQIFHEKEIAAWGDHVNTDAGKFQFPKLIYTTKAGVKIYWAGMDYDTNSATIFSYLGGYECRHVLVPIATDYVPEVDVTRARRLGYYTG